MANCQFLLSGMRKALYSLFVLYVITSVTLSLPPNSETYESGAAQSSFDWAESQDKVESMINQAQPEKCDFTCSNKVCISQSQQCDLVRNCYDDEFKCLIHRDGNVLYLKNNNYTPVCVNNLTRNAAIKMCHFLGKGPALKASWENEGMGILFVPKSSYSRGTLLNFTPGGVEQCRLLNLTCARKDCGKRAEHLDGLIREGALADQFPWQALVIINQTKRCVGTLINNKTILVATHCVKGATSASVLLGSVNGPTIQPHRVRIIRMHKLKSNPTATAAVLVLTEAVQMNDFVRTACLPYKRWLPNTECFITGWNKDDVENANNLKISKVKLLTHKACKRQYPFVSTVFMCAEANDAGKPSGYGKSGGPLVCRNEFGYFEVVGVLFKKQSCSETNSTSSLFVGIYDFVKSGKKKT